MATSLSQLLLSAATKLRLPSLWDVELEAVGVVSVPLVLGAAGQQNGAQRQSRNGRTGDTGVLFHFLTSNLHSCFPGLRSLPGNILIFTKDGYNGLVPIVRYAG